MGMRRQCECAPPRHAGRRSRFPDRGFPIDPISGGRAPTSKGARGRSVSGPRSAAEDLLQLVRRGLVELVIAALARRLVGPPALEVGGVAEPRALEVLERDLADQAEA